MSLAIRSTSAYGTSSARPTSLMAAFEARDELFEGEPHFVLLCPRFLIDEVLSPFAPHLDGVRQELHQPSDPGTFRVFLAFGPHVWVLNTMLVEGEQGVVVRGGSA